MPSWPRPGNEPMRSAISCSTLDSVPHRLKSAHRESTRWIRHFAVEVQGLLEEFGGDPREGPPLRPGAWDLVFDGRIVVELDEELHFNRYRSVTLRAGWADVLPWQDSYLKFCREREPDCLAAAKWGKRWTNPSCERLFGTASAPGNFENGGAPRWKQRALYDAVKDAAVLSGQGISLIRLSTHDVVGTAALDDVLRCKADCDLDALGQLVAERTLVG